MERASALSTLAAAYAETADFENAVKWQQKAIEFSTVEGKEKLKEYLKLYQAHQPCRDTWKE
ncbi:MAG: hypothetical protein U0992_08990 [Planctomycetaceae bacterium]